MDQRQGRCDLHTHSQASDGMQPPADNVKLAKQKGLSAVALTDHDTVAGVAEAQQAEKSTILMLLPEWRSAPGLAAKIFMYWAITLIRRMRYSCNGWADYEKREMSGII